MADDVSTPSTDAGGGQAADSTALSDIATNGALLNQTVAQLTETLNSMSDITLPAVNGGTGHDVYAVGDLLAADTTTTLERLADVATGNVLLSGGLNTLPAYGKVTPSHFSGTLPVANGGTGRASDTAFAVICGGTTSTSAHQSIASVGTSKQLLTSNGAGALPTFQSLVDGIGGPITFPDNIRYDLWLNSPFAFTITSTTTFCQSGSCTATFTVNAGSIGGTANSVSTTQQTQAHSFSVGVGDTVNLTISSNSSCFGMSFMIAITRP